MKTGTAFLFFITIVYNLSAQILDPVKWEYKIDTLGRGEYNLIFHARIDKPWHLYSQYFEEGGPLPTKFNFQSSGKYQLIGKVIEEPEPIEEHDEIFNVDVKYFKDEAKFIQKIKSNLTTDFQVKGSIFYQVCNEERCINFDKEFVFNISSSGLKSSKREQEIVKQRDSITVRQTIERSSEAEETEEASLWLFFFISLMAGLAGVLTPCVFPMIPMTVSFFMRNAENRAKAKVQALFYGISIIVIYTSIGAIITLLLGDSFINWLRTHWLPNIFFFLLFMLFAASFLGLFEIVIPGSIVNKADKQADKGGYIGTFFMALTLVIVSFSCTAPIIGSLIIEAATGEVIKPLVGMFGFSVAFAIPFTFLAFFPSLLNKLPHSGAWMNSVKIVLAFILIAFGMKFLIAPDQIYHWNIITRDIYIAVWIVLFSILGLYFLGKIRFANEPPVEHLSIPRFILALITFSFVLYLVPGLLGANLKTISYFLPPKHTQQFNLLSSIKTNIKTPTVKYPDLCEEPKYANIFHIPEGLLAYFDLKQGINCAKKLKKPVLLNFTGHSCTNCKKMEINLLSKPEIIKKINKNFILVVLYTDDNTILPQKHWYKSKFDGKIKKTIGEQNLDFEKTKFKVNAQPYFVIIDTEMNILTEAIGYTSDYQKFFDFLEKGINNFKNL